MKTKKSGDLSFTKTDDLQGRDGTFESMDLSSFTGAWTNTKEGSGQLPKVELRALNGELFFRAFGAGENELIDYGEAKCDVFAENTYKGIAMAFITGFQFNDIDVEISANVKLGVLVIQTYTKFRDGSNRLNYYAREFYGPDQD